MAIKTLRLTWLAVISVAILCVHHLRAQSPVDGPATSSTKAVPAPVVTDTNDGKEPTGGQTADQAIDKTADREADPSVEQSHPPEYAPSLDGSGLILMDSSRRIHTNIGGAVSSGFDSNPDNLGNAAGSAVFSYSPYFGVQASTPRIQYLFQYHPTFTRYSNYANQSMQVASAAITGQATQRLNWSLGISGSHGNDSVRLLAPSQPVAVGGVPTTGPSSGSYLPNAGMVTNFDVGLDLHYSISPRDSVTYRLGDSYIAYPALHDTGKVATAEFLFERSFKPNLGIIGYGQSAQYYGDLVCTTFGGGTGFRWQPRENTLFSLRGGPQLNTPGCKTQQGFSYSASITTKVLARAQLFITANRVPVAGFLGAGLWQDDFTGGYERRIHSADTITFDAGYIHSSTLLNISSYGGTFFDSSYLHAIHKNLTLACSYRSFVGNSGGTDINRNMLFVSLTLTPNTRSLSQ